MEHAMAEGWYFERSKDQQFADKATASAARAGIFASVTGDFNPETGKITYSAITITMEQQKELAAQLAANPDTQPEPIPTEVRGHLTMRSALTASMHRFALTQAQEAASRTAYTQWGDWF